MDFVTAADGVKLAYDVRGRGCAAPLPAGADAQHGGFRTGGGGAIVPRQVIRMDFRGRGASDFADPATYQVPQEAADVLALLDHLAAEGHDPRHLARGADAMVLAASAKDRLAGVILNDVGPEIMTEGLAAIMTYIGKPPDPVTLAEAAAPCPPPMPTVPERAARDLGRLRPAPLVRGPRRACTCATTRA
jgi:pimeloyl-ACP methyl ester carboxylesterase